MRVGASTSTYSSHRLGDHDVVVHRGCCRCHSSESRTRKKSERGEVARGNVPIGIVRRAGVMRMLGTRVGRQRSTKAMHPALARASLAQMAMARVTTHHSLSLRSSSQSVACMGMMALRSASFEARKTKVRRWRGADDWIECAWALLITSVLRVSKRANFPTNQRQLFRAQVSDTPRGGLSPM